ncbi:MAG TPA: hypothetical protein VF400_14650 [Anaeromyxobacteraceae bacterium]
MGDAKWIEVDGVKASDEKYSALLASEAGQPVVRFKGTVSTPNPALVLNPFVDAVHRAVTAVGAQLVTVDFNGFEFCNSSGFKSFIYWVDQIRSLPKDQQYRLRFMLSPAKRWQRTSLLALTCFAVDIIEIAGG